MPLVVVYVQIDLVIVEGRHLTNLKTASLQCFFIYNRLKEKFALV